MGDAIIDISRGSGIESIDRGEPRILEDYSAPFVGMVDHEGVMTGFDPTVEDVITALEGSALEGSFTATELYDQTMTITRDLVRRGERDMRLSSRILGRTVGRAIENNLGRTHNNVDASNVRNR